MAADAFVAGALFVAVSILRLGSTWQSTWRSLGIDPLAAILVYGAAWTAVVWLLGLYRLRTRWTARSELADIAKAGVLLALATFSVLFALKLPNVSRLFLLTLFASQIVFTVASRVA